MTLDLSKSDAKIIATFVEDQLPTWSADGREIIFLSRREGDRKSRLIKVGSTQIGSLGAVLGEGEYPSIGQTGQLVFRGWGNTGSGIRMATTSLENVQVVTTLDQDTAPALSPDGQRVVFMSRRDGNWEIYITNTDGSNLQRLTENTAEDGLPVWSPDGKAVAFVSNRTGKWAIWAMTPEGQDQQQLFTMEGSPDGFVGSNVPTAASRGWAEERISWTR
jgi:TolB protein